MKGNPVRKAVLLLRQLLPCAQINRHGLRTESQVLKIVE